MPDLGSYAIYVLSSYAVSLGLIGALVWASVARARRVRAQLDEIEGRTRRG
ncbi:heme exporter protein CcmD [Citreimonas sp.]|uniref:heme exporter protein CcmD n=1 Tax=Citreimonas sp. TaxID=3036715 RepID=UPI0035C7B19C